MQCELVYGNTRSVPDERNICIYIVIAALLVAAHSDRLNSAPNVSHLQASVTSESLIYLAQHYIETASRCVIANSVEQR